MRLRHPESHSGGMTSTDEFTVAPPPPPPASSGPGPGRVLRRSRTDRVGAGVAGGLGRYFNLDPVLFRVLFATAAFFGGAGILGYLIAWAAIPDEGTEHAAVDRWIAEMRKRRIPFWIVVGVGALIVWGIAFSWWMPHPFCPIRIVVIVLVLLFGRRGVPQDDEAQPQPAAPTYQYTPPTADQQTVSLDKDATASPAGAGPGAGPAAGPQWANDARSWLAESRAASRARRRRAFPVRISTVVTLVVTLAILAAIDAGTGIAIPVYAWVMFGIVGLGLLVGMVLRRTPWSLTVLLVPALIAIIGFGSTSASMHDGFGERDWTPTTSLDSSYRLAFGEGVLDLRHLTPLTAEQTVNITVAAGQVRIIMPTNFNATINANVHFGQIEVDGSTYETDFGRHRGGMNLQRVILPPPGATGQHVTINVHLADGNVSVDHR
jgi:phage shock protein PspC (stress-responsive transcriptional regulator)